MTDTKAPEMVEAKERESFQWLRLSEQRGIPASTRRHYERRSRMAQREADKLRASLSQTEG